MSERIDDPALYRKLCEPFPSVEAADEALRNFNAELRELRVKYKIPDISLVLRLICTTDAGTEGEIFLSAHHGDILLEETMLAWAFGYAQSQRQQRTAEMLKDAASVKRPKGGK